MVLKLINSIDILQIRGATEGVTWVVGTLVTEILEKLGFQSKVKMGLNEGYLGSF